MRHVFLESTGLSASRGLVINSSRDCHKEINVNKYTRVSYYVRLKICKTQVAQALNSLPGLLHPGGTTGDQKRSRLQVTAARQCRKSPILGYKNVRLKFSTDIYAGAQFFPPIAS